MPGLNRIGVSRKIDDDEQRRRLRDILNELKPPKGLGFIIRTAGLDQNKKELQRDLAYLSRLWQVVVRRIKKIKVAGRDLPGKRHDHADHPRHLHQRHRHHLGRRADRLRACPGVPADRHAALRQPHQVLRRHRSRCSTSTASRRRSPASSSATCRCPHGGSIVIDQTEALVAIDVNSGNFRADNNAEETAYQMNLQAAKEIARQLRLRDLGGVIVNDFIDMRDEKHRRGVEKAMRDAVKRDRARTKILQDLAVRHHRDDPAAHPAVAEAQRLPGLPALQRHRPGQDLREHEHRRDAHAPARGAPRQHPSHRHPRPRRRGQLPAQPKRKEITKLEEAGDIAGPHHRATPGAPPEMLEFVCFDNNNNEVKFLPPEEPQRSRRR